jgi:hypothetical protein
MNRRSSNQFATRTAVRRFVYMLAVPLVSSLLVCQQAPGEDGRHCSNATLKGDYVSYIRGVRSLFGITENFVGISLRRYDGNGNFTEEWSSFHGDQTGTQGGTGSGTYTVDANCTGKSTLYSPAPIPDILSDFVIMNDAKEVREIVTSPSSNVVTADFKRVR